jgi:hypothetical protein
LTGIPCSYAQAIAPFTEELPWLKGEDLDWVMGRALCDWLAAAGLSAPPVRRLPG